jgi:hypothetical protein
LLAKIACRAVPLIDIEELVFLQLDAVGMIG